MKDGEIVGVGAQKTGPIGQLLDLHWKVNVDFKDKPTTHWVGADETTRIKVNGADKYVTAFDRAVLQEAQSKGYVFSDKLELNP